MIGNENFNSIVKSKSITVDLDESYGINSGLG